MEELLELIQTRLSAGENLALVTVVARSGSAPRGAGARMLVNAEGETFGTVGGGILEHRAEVLAQDVLHAKTGLVQEFCLRNDQLDDIGMVCGGDVTLWVQYLPAGDPALLALTHDALERFRTGNDGWLVAALHGSENGAFELLDAAPAAVRFPALASAIEEQILVKCDDRLFFAQRLLRPGVVYLFGGGHVALELAALLEPLNFRYVVMDDRAEFSTPARFPGAERTVCGDFDHLLDHLSPGAADYAAVMTHGHLFDLSVQRQLLTTDTGYIGVMGSRRKTAFVFEKLREFGFSDPDLARIVTPIGLNIGGETPAEIALSIAAQLVQIRSERTHPKKVPHA